MPKTKTLPEGNLVEEALAALRTAQERVQQLQSELYSIPPAIKAIDWSDEEKAVETVSELERRRDALPHLISHAQKAEAEQEIRLHEAELEEAEAKRPGLDKRINELQEKYVAIQAELERARAEFQNLVIGVMSDIRRAKKAAYARLAALERESTYGPPEERGPVVRSTWQRSQENTDPGPVQDAPGLGFGVASVRDVLLSMQGGSSEAGQGSPSVVIPTKALEGAKKKAVKKGGEGNG